MRKWTKKQRAAFYRECYQPLEAGFKKWGFTSSRRGVALRDLYVGRSRN